MAACKAASNPVAYAVAFMLWAETEASEAARRVIEEVLIVLEEGRG